MARQKISYADASIALTENRNRREQSRLEAVQAKINERAQMRTTLDNARDLRFRQEHEHAMRMEAARDDNLSKSLKAIYITALDPNSLTEQNLTYANDLVDQYISEHGGATNILNKVKGNTYFLSRLTQIVENNAKLDVHDIENMDHDLEKELEVEGSEPIPEKKNDVHDMEPETKTDDDKGAKEGTTHDAFEDTPYKDFKPDGENGNFKQQNEGMKTESVEFDLDAELFDESVLMEADDDNSSSTEDDSKKDTDDDKSDIDVKSDGGDVNIKITNSKDEEKKDDDDDNEDDEEEEKEDESDDDDEEESEESEGEEEGSEEGGDTEIEDTDEEPAEDSEADEEIEVDTEEEDTPEGEEETDEEEVDSETEQEVEDTEEPSDTEDLEDLDDDGEPDDQDDEDIEDVESGDEEEVDSDEEASEDDDVKDIVGDDIDGSDQDSDDSIDGNDERGTLFKDLEDEPDVKRAIQIIRDRISDAEETFIKNNAKDKEAITKLVDKISSNVKTVEDAGEDSKEGKIAQESARCLDRYRKDIQQGRPVMSIFEIITRKLNGSMLKNKAVMESYKDEETGKIDEGLIIEAARCLYGWIETVQTLQLEKMDEALIEQMIEKF